MPFLAAVLALLLAASAVQADAADQTGKSQPRQRTQARIGAWKLTVQHDLFAGRVACELVDGRLAYERGALVVRLPRGADTSAALYRIDGGAVMTAADDYPSLATLGFAIWQDNLRNPSGGLVRIPAPKIAAARELTLEPAPSGRVWHFPLDGLPAALAAWKDAGCAQ
jgi:hypothetical protein